MTDGQEIPRAKDGRAPDVFRPGAWVPMREYADDDEVDFAVVGAGAGGSTLACKLAEAGFRVVAFDAGPYWRPLDDFASDEQEQGKLYWLDERICDGDDPVEMGRNNSGRGVGGSMVHFAMVTLRFRPEWFKARTELGYGTDWPVSWEEMWRYYAEVEEALKISGPLRYPWGPPRGRYPYRPHEVNAAGMVVVRGCEALDIAWAPVPLATVSAPRGKAPPCVYRGFCVIGCSTNAKQSPLVTWLPRALRAGAEVRDLAMVGRIELGPNGRATGVHYHREGRWRFQKAKHVVVAGYAVETPRLLLNSACAQFPDGLANRSGLVGKHLMIHAGHGVFGKVREEVRWYKGPPSMALTEHWNYNDEGKDFHGGYCFMGQGPLPASWASAVSGSTGLWGEALRLRMTDYIHNAGVSIVGETESQERNRVTLAEERDGFGLPVTRITFSYSDNDRRLIRHALASQRRVMEAAGATGLFDVEDSAHLLGTCRMGTDPARSVTDADGRTWDIPNLWICDGSLFPTSGGVNPSLTIQALACRTGDRIRALAARGEL